MSRIGKKLINEVDRCVDDALEGFTLLNPGLKLHPDYRFVSRTNEEINSDVAILSGGGSGHEPFCTGYVGKGMLAGAVAGSVFTSPPKTHILHALRHLNHFYKGGVLVIIPNYTGDCLNFGVAVEQAESEGINVDAFVFGDDCASEQNSMTGRRGMCGLSLAYKMGGGLSAAGKNMSYIMESLKQIQKNISTLGVSLEACSLPGQPPLFSVADDQMELGTGVHGEAGIAKIKMASAKEAVKIVLERLFKSLDLTKPGQALVVLINNLGATSQLEQNIICKETHNQLRKADMNVKRMYAGMLMTSLDMSGFQISLLKVPKSAEEEWLEILDKNTDAPCWVGSVSSRSLSTTDIENIRYTSPSQKTNSTFSFSQEEQCLLNKCLQSACQILKENESKLNELDSGCGDGDCGTTLKNFAEGILETLPNMNLECPAKVLQTMSEIAETKMGGTSGAIYSLGFTSMSKYFMNVEKDQLPSIWAEAMKIGVRTVMKYGRASQGDRTIVDALFPAVEIFSQVICGSDLKNAICASVEAAQKGCKATKSMKARAGRASYVSEDRLIDVDAGAYGFVLWFDAIGKCF